MGDALDRLRVLLARTFVAPHRRITAEGTVAEVEAHWRDLPASVRKTFKESMHAPSVQGGESHPFDKPDTMPLKAMPPGQRAAFEAVQRRVGEEKLGRLKQAVIDSGGNQYVRKPGYLKPGRGPIAEKKPGTTTCSVCGQTLHPSLKKGQWAHSKKADHAPKPVTAK